MEAYNAGLMTGLLVFIVAMMLVYTMLQFQQPKLATQEVTKVDVIELSVQRGQVRRMVDAYASAGYQILEVLNGTQNSVKVTLSKNLTQSARTSYRGASAG